MKHIRIPIVFALVMANYALVEFEASAALTIFSDRAVFESSVTGLVFEDFEEATVGDNLIEFFASGLNSASNNGTFAPGDIVPGVELRSSSHPDGLGLFAIGNNSTIPVTNSKVVGSTFFVESLNVLFAPSVFAAGMNVQLAGNVPHDIAVSIFGTSGLLGTHTMSSVTDQPGAYFGVASTDAIVSINLADVGGTDSEIIDNLGFSTVPEPNAGTTCCIATLLLNYRRRRKS